MGLALLISSVSGDALASGWEINLFGYGSDTSVEQSTQASCTEGADITLLGARIISGNSADATFQFRDAGANGQNVITITGTGTAEDTTHTDALGAGDLFNIAYTDTGTASTISWLRANIEFAVGHGNFHGAATFTGQVFDVESSTRFLPLAGIILADGNATEDNVEWLNRGYTSFEALQVRVSANARLNNSDFRNRINGGDGSLLCQFATLVTGLVSDTSPADTLADGNTVNVAITLGAGVQDLTVVFVCATSKSSSSKSESFGGQQNGLARTAGATAHYFPPGGYIASLTAFTEAQARAKIGFAAVVSNLRCYLSANTYTGNGTLKLYQNGVAVITTTITASGGAAWYENATDMITIDADDELSFEFDEGTSGSITIHSAGITFAPVAAGGQMFMMFPPRLDGIGRGGIFSGSRVQ